MRKVLALLFSVITIQATLLSGAAHAANQSDFLGTWTSIDTDGSNQSLRISGGGSDHYSVFYYDESATSACEGAPARVTGTGVADGDDLFVVGALSCSPGGNFIRGRIGLDYHFDPATGTLTDFSGVVWYRA